MYQKQIRDRHERKVPSARGYSQVRTYDANKYNLLKRKDTLTEIYWLGSLESGVSLFKYTKAHIYIHNSVLNTEIFADNASYKALKYFLIPVRQDCVLFVIHIILYGIALIVLIVL